MDGNTVLTTRTEKEIIADLTRPRENFKRIVSQSICNTSGGDVKTSQKYPAELCLESNNGPPYYHKHEIEDGNGSEVEEEEEEVIFARKERKGIHAARHQDSQFGVWIQNYQLNKKARAAAIDEKNEENQSTKWLVKNTEGKKIISSPRDYQVELFEKAKTENIIAVLDTGSGKTLIAVLLLRHVIAQEVEARAMGMPKRISFFLVDSVALVFQQFAVLDANLDQPMEQFCGNMVNEHGSKAAWSKAFAENMVIVCTADLFIHCLHHSFISMDQVNLLIFDEAHHAKKNHVYARIIKDFYLQEATKARRPKIFGMTASPVDSKVDVRKAALELETLLHCRIATAADPAVMQYVARSKHEQIADYAPLQPPFKTPLYWRIESEFKDVMVFQKLMAFAQHATSELGSWCADHMWSQCMREDEVKELMAKTERKFQAGKILSMEECEHQKSKIQAAQEIISAHTFDVPKPTLDSLSSKTIRLINILKERFERATNDKAIIFVDRRYTAKIMTELFDNKSIGTPHLRVGTLVGIGSGAVGDSKISLKRQVLILRKFRQGKFNCLFATSVAEEGLDIPDCNLVIRFHLYRTVTQYVQSRGRARQMNSRYIHFMERGNREHAALITEVKAKEAVLRQFCQSLPDDRLLTGNDRGMEELLAKEKSHRVYTEPGNGAKLTYRMSLVVLANFTSSLPHNSHESLHPEYVVTSQGPTHFICEVILPESSPIRGAIGRPHSTKQVAKCSAAFDACLLLRRGQYIDENLQSTYTKQLPAMRNAHLAVSSKKKAGYKMRTKPSLWTVDMIPISLYLTVFSITNPSAIPRPTQPLGILTRSALPQFPCFPLFFGRNLQSDVKSTTYAKIVEVNATLLATLNTFTLRIFQDVFSKEYESNVAHMPYFLVPIKNGCIVDGHTEPTDIFDWKIMNFVEQNLSLSWDQNTPEHFFENRFLADTWDGSRKLWSIRVTHDYKPLDPVPPNTAPRIGAGGRRNNSSIIEYSVSFWGKNRAEKTSRIDQPVLQAEYIPLRRNLLDNSNEADPEIPTLCFVVAEPMKISALPTTVVAMVYLFPAIIHRIESYLIAVEACEMLHLSIPADLALEALTKDSDNTDEHSQEQIHVQRGMGKNYERLEFLGDCFLKMATSIAIYTLYPESDEFHFHVKRMLLLCNKNLFNNALELGLETYIRSEAFNRRVWYPENLTLKKGKATFASKEHFLGDKTIADVCEALIGAALLTQHETGNMDNAVRAVTEFVSSEDHRMTSFADYKRAYKLPKYQTEASTASQRDLAARAQSKHPYVFKYPRLLRSAFVHPSYPFTYEHVPSYQRLEFLGDSLFDMACINFLFYRHADRNPQWLTEHKMAMVSNQFLGALCVDLGFHKCLLSFSSTIQSQIQEYVTTITDARNQAEEEAEAAGKSRSDYARDFWVHTKESPKCLPDIIEAYIGAVFIDSDYNYAEVERFFDMHVKHYFEDMKIYDTFANKHPVTFLHRLLSHFGCNRWKLHSNSLSDYGDGSPPACVATVMIHEQVIAFKEAISGRYAKTGVASMVLDMLTGLGLPEFRATYGCDCQLNDDGDDVRIADDIEHGTAV